MSLRISFRKSLNMTLKMSLRMSLWMSFKYDFENVYWICLWECLWVWMWECLWIWLWECLWECLWKCLWERLLRISTLSQPPTHLHTNPPFSRSYYSESAPADSPTRCAWHLAYSKSWTAQSLNPHSDVGYPRPHPLHVPARAFATSLLLQNDAKTVSSLVILYSKISSKLTVGLLRCLPWRGSKVDEVGSFVPGPHKAFGRPWLVERVAWSPPSVCRGWILCSANILSLSSARVWFQCGKTSDLKNSVAGMLCRPGPQVIVSTQRAKEHTGSSTRHCLFVIFRPAINRRTFVTEVFTARPAVVRTLTATTHSPQTRAARLVPSAVFAVRHVALFVYTGTQSPPAREALPLTPWSLSPRRSFGPSFLR